MVDLDTRAGGLQNNCCRCRDEAGFVMGPDQEGLLISVLEKLQLKGITQADAKTWTKTPPTFLDVRKEVESRIEDGCKEPKLALKLARLFNTEYSTVRSRPHISSDYSL